MIQKYFWDKKIEFQLIKLKIKTKKKKKIYVEKYN